MSFGQSAPASGPRCCPVPFPYGVTSGMVTMSNGDDIPDEVLDDEWEDFQKLMTEYKLRHKHQTNMLDWSAKPKPKPQTAFYPCPPPMEEDKDMEMETMDAQMYGRFTRDLGEYAKEEARRLKKEEKKRRKKDRQRNEELYKYRGACTTKLLAGIGWVWNNTFAKLGEDWVFLTMLGLIMACLSYFMDTGIGLCNKGRLWLYRDLATHPALQYFAWVSLPLSLILFAAGFVHLVAPQSIGSGIPEMKTILRGVALKEYLTFRTLVAKVIGLTATLGSGMPVGKEGPFVHIACTVATTMSKVVTSFQGIYQNESRNTEMLAAACAVGVASCFASPIGGVLFSIEVTTVYFAVRNYWRGFFGSVCAATSFRLLAVWFQKEDTVVAVFGTNFTHDFPFDPQELAVFAAMGVVCGFGGALYVWSHRQYVLFMRKNKKVNAFLQKNRFLYPGIITLVTQSMCFPLGVGRYMAGDLTTHDQVSMLFSNFTWTKDEFTVEEAEVMRHWSTGHSNVFVSLAGFVLYTYIFSIIASTIPVPAGSFIPVFKIGAGIGRIFGELMHILFPLGVRYSGIVTPIIPGGYATVGAAAFSGAVTHTVSTSVIVVEMTGQITHIIPIMIAVLIANATAALLQPSIYDNIILIKKLPYLPDLLPSGSGMYSIYVEDFMFRDVKYIWNGMTYHDLKRVLQENRDLRGFPLVDNPDSMILLGSMQRMELIRLIEKHVGRERRLEVAALWQKEAQQRAMEEFEKRVQEEVERRQRRPSRFEVTPTLELFQLRQQLSNSDLQPRYHHPVFGGQPKKSILKKTGSFNLQQYGMMTPTHGTPYTTITGAESRIKLAFDNIFRKSTKLQDVTPSPEFTGDNVTLAPAKEPIQIIPADSGTATPMSSHSPFKKVQLPRERVIDMSAEDQKAWEDEEMKATVKLEDSHIDPAPFQLVERTSLLKVHSIFSMVGVNHAYVTAIGRLVGVVGLKELRKVIEDVNAGTFSSQNTKPENIAANSVEDAAPSEPLVEDKKPSS